MSSENFILGSQRSGVDLRRTESVEDWIEIEDGTNRVPGYKVYVDDFDGWLARAPAIGSEHPDYPPLRLRKLRGERIEGYLVRVQLNYESWSIEASYPGREAGAIKRQGGQVGLSEEPILTFALFKSLGEGARVAASEYMSSSRTKADFDKFKAALGSSPEELKLIELLSQGVESYFNPGLTHTERLTGVKLTDFELGKTGKVFAPAKAPSIGTRTWLYMGASYDEQDDGTYSGTRTWQASEPGGWDPVLYPPA